MVHLLQVGAIVLHLLSLVAFLPLVAASSIKQENSSGALWSAHAYQLIGGTGDLCTEVLFKSNQFLLGQKMATQARNLREIRRESSIEEANDTISKYEARSLRTNGIRTHESRRN